MAEINCKEINEQKRERVASAKQQASRRTYNRKVHSQAVSLLLIQVVAHRRLKTKPLTIARFYEVTAAYGTKGPGLSTIKSS
jgi:Trk-type K+ transport system membrane component